MAKRGQEFDESDHRSKTSKLDFSVNDHYDDDDEINLEEERMQVDEELEGNKLLEHNAAKKEDGDNTDKALEQNRDLEKGELGRSNEGQQESVCTVAVVASPCNPKDSELPKDESESAAGSSGGRKKNHENSEERNAGTTNGAKNRSELKPRGYQLELAGPGIAGQNSIICAPTGSGKTMTAALVCKSLAERMKAAAEKENGRREFKAVFVVCLRNLVAQQCDALSQFLPNIKIGMLDEKEFLDAALRFYDVVVLTSQILVNALEQGSVQLKTLSLIIFDECHHANLDHPYNKLMRLYHLEKMKGSNPLPQILGMTASLGVGSASDLGGAKGHYVKICANLDCTRISHVRDPKNKAELEESNPKPSENQLKMVDKRPQKNEFYVVMTKLMEEIEVKYLKEGPMQVPRGTQKYESAVSTVKQEAEKTKERAEEMVACEVLAKMNLAWMVHDELRTKDAVQLLSKYFLENLESRPGAVEKALCRCYSDARRDLERIERQEKLDDWPLLKELHSLLGQLFSENNESHHSHGIVMASTIQYVDGLMSFLHDYSPNKLIFPQKFVGHRTNIENSMTESEQEHVLLQFRRGGVNLLVSTDVTQEGLDIPHCNFVIRFNFVSNEIGAVQAKGRARAPDSKCFLIANRGSVNVDREMKNIGKERWMLQALDDVVSTSSEELQELIKKCQEDLYRKLSPAVTPMEVSATGGGDNGSSQYSIHCRRCKAFLCSAEHLVHYGCHYICVDEAFKQRIIVEADPSPKEFREDTLTGKSLCCGCREIIGSVLTYRRGSRPDGYNIGSKSTMWKKRDRENSYWPIKKWNSVPFVIKEETRSLA